MTDLPFVVSFNSLVNCFATIPIKVPLGMTSDREPHEGISLCEPCDSSGDGIVPAEFVRQQLTESLRHALRHIDFKTCCRCGRVSTAN